MGTETLESTVQATHSKIHDFNLDSGTHSSWRRCECDLTIWGPRTILLVSSQVVRWGHVTGSNQWNVTGNDICYFRTKAWKDWGTSHTFHLSLPWWPWRPWDEMLVDRRVPRSLSGIWQNRSNQPILDFAWMRYASFMFVCVCWVMSDVLWPCGL